MHFFDEFAVRMGNARCRVFHNGRLVNLTDSHADAGACLRIRVPASTNAHLLEWAPAHMPLGPPYPFRRRYYVAMGQSPQSRVSRRLHNIGFSGYPKLSSNVADFQAQYVDGLPDGEACHIHELLGAYHDLPTLPPLGTKVRSPSALSASALDGGAAASVPEHGAPPPGGFLPVGAVKTQFYVPLQEGCCELHCRH